MVNNFQDKHNGGTILAERVYDKEYFSSNKSKKVLNHTTKVVEKLSGKTLNNLSNHNVGVLLSLPSIRKELVYALFIKGIMSEYSIYLGVDTKGERSNNSYHVESFIGVLTTIPFDIVSIHEVVTETETKLELSSVKGYETTISIGVYNEKGFPISKNSECEIMYKELGVNKRTHIIPLTVNYRETVNEETLYMWCIQIKALLEHYEDTMYNKLCIVDNKGKIKSEDIVRRTLMSFYNDLIRRDFRRYNYGLAYSQDGTYKPVRFKEDGYETIKGTLIDKPEDDLHLELWFRSIIDY